MVKRALVLGSALLALGVGGQVAAATTASASVVTPHVVCGTTGVASVSRATVLARGLTWVTAKVPYSQTACHTDTGGTYRTDCSGFVSMSWGLPLSYSTSSLPSISTVIDKADLQPGDILDLPGTHTVLFVGWYDAAHTKANLNQEGSTTSGTFASTGSLMSKYATYTAYRYNHITA